MEKNEVLNLLHLLAYVRDKSHYVVFKVLYNACGAEGLSSAAGKRWKNQGKRWKNSTFPQLFRVLTSEKHTRIYRFKGGNKF